MTPEFAAQILRDMLTAALWVAGPLLIVGFIIGILVNLVQVATSLQDPAFSAMPRLAGFLIAFVILMPWMMHKLMTYTTALLGDLGRYAR